MSHRTERAGTIFGFPRDILSRIWPVCAIIVASIAPFSARAATKYLPGHVPSIITKLTAKGTLPLTNRLNLAIGLPLHDDQALEQFLVDVYDPASPNYRRYLNPGQFTEKFGPTESDYAAVAQFAAANHLTVTARHANRLLLDVNGTVDDIQRALHITLRTYRHPSEARDFYAPDTEPSVDAALPIADISGLNDYVRPHPLSVHPSSAHATPRGGSGSNGTYFGNDFRAAYMPGVSLTGSGETVGLVEFDGFYASDISTYETAAGISPIPVKTVLLDNYNGTPTTGADSGNVEVSLDIEIAIAMAPGLSSVVSFEGGPNGQPNDVLNSMASSNQIKQFSCSWGWGGGPSGTTDNIFKEMAAQGQSFFDAVGDSDAFTIGSSSTNGVDNPSLDNSPASSPYITAVGGTTLSTSGPGGIWTAEQVWNWGLNSGNYDGTCGGVSSYYAIPYWQTNIDMSANGGSTVFRNVPDVAFTADNVFVDYSDGSTTDVGGTSCAAPLWAAVTALINEQAIANGNTNVGFLNPALYALGQGPAYTSCFHDIVTGNNVWPSSPTNYYAVAGYDLCTGWGTPAGQPLIDALSGPPAPLAISPLGDIAATGPVGGPFSPSGESFLLTNQSSNSITWAVNTTSPWLTVTPASGVLNPGQAMNVIASMNAATSNLLNGGYTNTIVFTNSALNGAQQTTFTLQVGQPLVQNGGFETGSFSGWKLVGNTIVESHHNIEVYNAVEDIESYPLVVHSGNYGAFLGDTQLAALSQTVPTVPGQNYLLSFWLDNPLSGTGQQFIANWNSNTLVNWQSPPAFTWTNFQFIVSATNSSTLLQFGAENVADYFGLDDVSVTPLPPLQFNGASASSGAFVLTWAATPGVNYQVQFTTDLTSGNWENLGGSSTTSGTSLSASDPSVTNSSSQRFYRLLAFP